MGSMGPISTECQLGSDLLQLTLLEPPKRNPMNSSSRHPESKPFPGHWKLLLQSKGSSRGGRGLRPTRLSRSWQGSTRRTMAPREHGQEANGWSIQHESGTSAFGLWTNPICTSHPKMRYGRTMNMSILYHTLTSN